MSEETEIIIPAENNKGKASHNILVAFLSALLLCCGLYGMAIYLHNDHIVEGQNRIIRIYTHQIKKMESAKTPLNMRDSQREKEMQAFHEEVKSLLELEFNRIQGSGDGSLIRLFSFKNTVES